LEKPNCGGRSLRAQRLVKRARPIDKSQRCSKPVHVAGEVGVTAVIMHGKHFVVCGAFGAHKRRDLEFTGGHPTKKGHVQSIATASNF
jgi:hypothetical protein